MSKQLTLRTFIRLNRDELDRFINSVLAYVPATASCNCPKSQTDHYHAPVNLNDKERRQWILSDEGLYRWARSEGVRI